MKESVKGKKEYFVDGIYCLAYRLCVPVQIESQARSFDRVSRLNQSVTVDYT